MCLCPEAASGCRGEAYTRGLGEQGAELEGGRESPSHSRGFGTCAPPRRQDLPTVSRGQHPEFPQGAAFLSSAWELVPIS